MFSRGRGWGVVGGLGVSGGVGDIAKLYDLARWRLERFWRILETVPGGFCRVHGAGSPNKEARMSFASAKLI
jgi:hypothetical protein